MFLMFGLRLSGVSRLRRGRSGLRYEKALRRVRHRYLGGGALRRSTLESRLARLADLGTSSYRSLWLVGAGTTGLANKPSISAAARCPTCAETRARHAKTRTIDHMIIAMVQKRAPDSPCTTTRLSPSTTAPTRPAMIMLTVVIWPMFAMRARAAALTRLVRPSESILTPTTNPQPAIERIHTEGMSIAATASGGITATVAIDSARAGPSSSRYLKIRW